MTYSKLIKTLEEVRNHLPVTYTDDFDRIDPYLSTAETIYIRQIIGREQFKKLALIYAAANFKIVDIVDDDIREAIILVQRAVVNLGYFTGIPALSLMIGATGIQVFSNSDTKQAFKWQIDDLKDSIRELGFNAIEELLLHLEQSPDKFPEYIDSPEYIKNERFLIQTAADFSDHFNIGGSRYTFHVIAYLMKRVEDQTVKKSFGGEFFDLLKADVLSDDQAYLIENFLKPGIALLTGAKSLRERLVTFKNGIASVNLDGNTGDSQNSNLPATQQQINEACNQLEKDGSQFLQDGLEYILANKELYPGYVPVPARRRFRSPSDSSKGIFLA